MTTYKEDKSNKEITISSVVNDISKSITVEDTIVFIGAGLSRRLYRNENEFIDGYMTMDEFIDKLYEKPHNMTNADGESIPRKKSPFSIIKEVEAHNKSEISKALNNEYKRPYDFTCSRYKALLGIPFKAFITFNFDPMLKKASESKGIPVLTKDDLSFRRLADCPSPISIYLHGLIDDGYDAIIISDKSFEIYYGKEDQKNGIAATDISYGNPIFKCALLSLILEHDLLFLGCSFQEEVLKKLMPFVGGISEHGRVLLLPHDECRPEPGMTVLKYPDINGDKYAALFEIIRAIKDNMASSTIPDFKSDGGILE